MDEFSIGMGKDELIREFGEPDKIIKAPVIDPGGLATGVSSHFLDQPYTEIWRYYGRGPIYDSNGFEKICKVTIGAALTDQGQVGSVGWQEGHK